MVSPMHPAGHSQELPGFLSSGRPGNMHFSRAKSRFRPPILAIAGLLLGAQGCTAFLETPEDDESQGSPDETMGGDGDQNPLGTGGAVSGVGGSIPTGSGGLMASGGNGPASGGATGSGGSPNPGTGGADSGPACKRGLSFDRWVNQPSLADLDVLSPKVHWFYNWHHTKNPDIAGGYLSRGFEWAPMVRDAGFSADEANAAITSDVKFLLGFNEPNVQGNGGVDMSVEQVVALWPQVEAIANAHGLELVSPAVTFTNIDGERDGPEWLDRFFELCPACRVDAIAMHTYTCDAEWVADHLEPYRKFGLPIWVTEFACISDDANLVRTFMEETVDLLEHDPDVARYAWFMSRSGNLSILGSSGQLTALGQVYVNLPEAKPCAK